MVSGRSESQSQVCNLLDFLAKLHEHEFSHPDGGNNSTPQEFWKDNMRKSTCSILKLDSWFVWILQNVAIHNTEYFD